MYRIEIDYPLVEGEDKFFDTGYYRFRHMPWAKELLGGDAVIRDTAVEACVPSGGEVRESICRGVLYVEDLDTFFENMARSGAEFQADLPNFTNMLPPAVRVYEIL